MANPMIIHLRSCTGGLFELSSDARPLFIALTKSRVAIALGHRAAAPDLGAAASPPAVRTGSVTSKLATSAVAASARRVLGASALHARGRPKPSSSCAQQIPATGAQYVPRPQYPLSGAQHDCAGWCFRLVSNRRAVAKSSADESREPGGRGRSLVPVAGCNRTGSWHCGTGPRRPRTSRRRTRRGSRRRSGCEARAAAAAARRAMVWMRCRPGPRGRGVLRLQDTA